MYSVRFMNKYALDMISKTGKFDSLSFSDLQKYII
jgi:hypothetical protein